MNLLFIGDLVGKAGRRILADQIDRVTDRHRVDYSIVNIENAADGFGITQEIAEEILAMRVDCMTSGNHIWDRDEIRDYIARQRRLLRPINYPRELPGSGVHFGETPAGLKVGVINVMGRVFMPPLDDPFRAAGGAVEELRRRTPIVVVDIHAEATSEKNAMGRFLDGRASAVLGTHTHVQTADERILPGGTAYITDVGMTGAHDSVIGMDKDAVLSRFLNHTKRRIPSAKGDPRLCAVLVQIAEDTGRALSIRRLVLDRSGLRRVGGGDDG